MQVGKSIQIAVVNLLLLFASCGPSQRAIHFPSPDGTETISVIFPASHGSHGLQVVYRTGGALYMVATESVPVSIGLAEVAWAEKDKRVILLLCGSQRPIVCFDRPSRSSSVEHCQTDLVKAELRKHYDLPVPSEPLAWACSNAGREAFWHGHALARSF